MNRIEFRLVPTDEWFGDAVVYNIDGRSFIEMVREFETSYAESEGSPHIAGAYMGIAARSHLPPSQHFWGIGERQGLEVPMTDILWCGDCGEPGCWPLRARITIDDDRVVWSDFEQPHRSTGAQTKRWIYDGFGPFVFDRHQYDLSLRTAGGSA
jgi:hypothetical protein